METHIAEQIRNKFPSINIRHVQGDVIGVGMIRLGFYPYITAHPPENKYHDALRKFCLSLNRQISDRQVQEEKLRSLNERIDELAREMDYIDMIKTQIDPKKQQIIEQDISAVMSEVLNILPEAAQNRPLFGSLAVLNQIISKNIYEILDDIISDMRF
jgi:hypothetical protein